MVASAGVQRYVASISTRSGVAGPEVISSSRRQRRTTMIAAASVNSGANR